MGVGEVGKAAGVNINSSSFIHSVNIYQELTVCQILCWMLETQRKNRAHLQGAQPSEGSIAVTSVMLEWCSSGGGA